MFKSLESFAVLPACCTAPTTCDPYSNMELFVMFVFVCACWFDCWLFCFGAHSIHPQVYFRVWRGAEGQYLEKVEMLCLQVGVDFGVVSYPRSVSFAKRVVALLLLLMLLPVVHVVLLRLLLLLVLLLVLLYGCFAAASISVATRLVSALRFRFRVASRVVCA